MIPASFVVLEPPVDPDAETAQRWAADELARSEYHTSPNLLHRLLDWVAEQLDRLQDTSIPAGPGPLLIVAVIVVAVVVVSFVVAGPVRRSRAVRGAVGSALLDDTRTAEQIRDAALAAAAAGHLALATAEWFRALVRGLEERTLLDERPGRTADEAATAAGVRLPELADELAAAAVTFDAVVYGHRAVGAADEARMRALEHRARRVRPVAPVGPTVTEVV
ncbi:MAG: DUF4129 domain-containing protein [Micrococcales bacterium]|nr:DUF4129 domain-containing protein [Micrococcales bacterium]